MERDRDDKKPTNKTKLSVGENAINDYRAKQRLGGCGMGNGGRGGGG